MAIIDQSEIDSLLEEAQGLADEASDVLQQEEIAAPPPLREVRLPADPDVRRILKIKVPVIVQLAERMMPIESIRALAVGSIIEFEKSVEDELQLLINNRRVGSGNCVKVGENFGLRVTRICDQSARIRSLGPQ